MSDCKDALIEFEMDGGRYCFPMPAESFDDAERRMRAIRMTGKVAGWPCYAVSSPSLIAYVALPFVTGFCWLLNLLGVKPKGAA